MKNVLSRFFGTILIGNIFVTRQFRRFFIGISDLTFFFWMWIWITALFFFSREHRIAAESIAHLVVLHRTLVPVTSEPFLDLSTSSIFCHHSRWDELRSISLVVVYVCMTAVCFVMMTGSWVNNTADRPSPMVALVASSPSSAVIRGWGWTLRPLFWPLVVDNRGYMEAGTAYNAYLEKELRLEIALEL